MRGCLLALIWVGCTPSVRQVPVHEPHGELYFRVVHRGKSELYESEVRLDDDTFALAERGRNLRVKPGLHYVQLSSRGRTYDLADERVTVPNYSCVDRYCTGPTWRAEDRTVLQEQPGSFCQRDLDLQVPQGKQQLALMVVGEKPGDCTACASDNLAARSCP